MPELPDITVYLERIEARFLGRKLEKLVLSSPFVLRSVEVPPAELIGKKLVGTARVGKRIVMQFEDDLFAVVHLMRAGRLKWVAPGAKPPGKISLVLFQFGTGPIKGFAVTLSLGIGTSMFTAITVTRALVTLVYGSRTDLKTRSIGGRQIQSETVTALTKA